MEFKENKATLNLKIAFTGPESSGKTTLSKALAAHFSASWFVEHARDYLLQRNGKYDFEDIEKIAIEQENIRNKPELLSGLSVFDTENIVLYIWSMVKFQRCSSFIENQVANQKFDLYFLCNPEGVPWEYDPLRESENCRHNLFELYFQKMSDLHLPFFVLEGDFETRFSKVVEVVQGFVNSKELK